MSVGVTHQSSGRRTPAVLPRRGTRFRCSKLFCSLSASRSGRRRIPQSLRDVVVLTFLYAGLALAWNIAGGYAGLISFGHAAFFGIGAYTSTILFVRVGVTPWIGIWCGALLAAVFGAAARADLRAAAGPFFILSTLAAAEVVRIGALNWASLTGGPEGLSILPVAGLANMVFASKTTYAVLMLRLSVSGLCRHQSVWKARATAITCSRSATMRMPPAPPASIRCWCRTAAMALSAGADRDRRLAVRAVFPVSRSDIRHFAGAVVPVCAAAGSRRAGNRHRSGARLFPDHAAVGIAALVSRQCQRRACTSSSTAPA